jgi:hypothetical protein
MPVIPGGTVEVGRVNRTTNYTVDQTTIASAPDIFSSDITWVSDGSPYLIEFFCPRYISANTNSSYINVFLVDGSGADLGQMGLLFNNSTTGLQFPVHLTYFYTPNSGVAASVNIRATYAAAATNVLGGGAAGAGQLVPMFLRVSKIVNQNDGLKPFWTPPVVTQLPSQATEGDQVVLYSSSPYAGYQSHYYAGGSWRTLDDSRATGAWQSWTPTISQVATASLTVNYAKYTVIGKSVSAKCRVTVASGTGTVGTAITMGGLPVAAVASESIGGTFRMFDSGVTNVVGAAIGASTTSANFYRNADGNAVGLGSTTFSAGDIFDVHVTYEAP